MCNKIAILRNIIRIVLPKFGDILSTGIEKAIIMEDKNMNFSKLYDELRKSGLTTVDDLIKWMQAAKIIDESLLTKRRVRRMFASAEKEVQVDLDEFQTIMERMTRDNQKLVEDIIQMSGNPKMMEALVEATKAFQETEDKE